MRNVLDPDPDPRSEAEWRELLQGLVDSLSSYTGIRFEPTAWVVEADRPGYASASNCVRVRGAANPILRLDAHGAVCVTVNFGEAAWASCDLVIFGADAWLNGPGGADLVTLSLGPAGWERAEWVPDEHGEWEWALGGTHEK